MIFFLIKVNGSSQKGTIYFAIVILLYLSMEIREKPSLGEQLKKARADKNMTQEDVHQLSNVSVFLISGLETGRIKNTSTHAIRGLQYALGIVFEI
jgi:predicted transcriptional regulator